jgi:hypothetical protein
VTSGPGCAVCSRPCFSHPRFMFPCLACEPFMHVLSRFLFLQSGARVTNLDSESLRLVSIWQAVTRIIESLSFMDFLAVVYFSNEGKVRSARVSANLCSCSMLCY